MRKKFKSKWIYLLLMVSILTVMLASFSACSMILSLFKKPVQATTAYSEVKDFKSEIWYIGTKAYMENFEAKSEFSLQEFIGEILDIGVEEATWVSSNNAIASMDGDVISVKNTGDIVMKITKKGTGEVIDQPFTIVEGINIFTFEDLYTATNTGNAVIIQQDLRLQDARKMQKTDFGCNNENPTMNVTKNMYGNGHRISAQDLTFKSATDTGEWFTTCFDVVGNNGVVIDGIYMSGKDVKDGEELKLGAYEPYGILFSFSGSTAKSIKEYDTNPTKFPINLIKNCILENANRIVTISNARVRMEGTYVRNGADSCISIGTFNDRGPSDIYYEDCVFENGLVATMLFYCYQSGVSELSFSRMTFEGFVELYNWKNTKETSLMPKAESVSGIVNPIIAGELGKKEYATLFYWSADKKDSYVNAGIFVIATGGGKKNYPEFRGLDEQNFAFRPLPLPAAAGAFINICNVIGYDVNPPIKPNEAVNMNAERLQELWHGRK